MIGSNLLSPNHKSGRCNLLVVAKEGKETFPPNSLKIKRAMCFRQLERVDKNTV